jgi:hypothetical protein
VVVFDADTAKYKRHWGAYGHKPDDTYIPVYNPDAPPAQQFRKPVHCAELSISPSVSNPNSGEWFNLKAFVEEPQGSFGNLGRNPPGITGPGIFEWDGSILKNFNFTEQRFLQFRFEVFNASNHPNFGDPGLALAANTVVAGQAVPGTGTFGEITSTRVAMRQVQLSLKLVF